MQQAELSCVEVFAKKLRETGGRLTDERRTLLQVVRNKKGHFEAEDIFRELQKKGHKVSLATVYRNFSVMVEAGILRRVALGLERAPMQFECIWGQEHHDHLVCLGCGKKVEFSYPAIDVLQEEVAREHSFTLVGHHLELHGLCSACQESAGDSDDDAIRLSELKPGKLLRLVRFDGGGALLTRLHGFGLHEGRVIRLIRRAPFGGPLLIEDVGNQSRIMLDRKLAAHVLVSEVENEG
jgi:Fur family ferric uptake transcriptional regulator